MGHCPGASVLCLAPARAILGTAQPQPVASCRQAWGHSSVGVWPSLPRPCWWESDTGTTPGPGAPRGDPCPLLPLPGGRRWMGCRQRGHLLAVLRKVNGRPAAVGAMDVSAAGDCAVAATVSWRRSPGLLGLALLWRNSSAPPGALPAAACHRHHRRRKVFIQQFPRELGTWGEGSQSSGCGGPVAVAQVPCARCWGAATPGGVGGQPPSVCRLGV